VEFHDSGPGLADTSRIFDPFFTTKPVGKGTGLGLSICYGIVKEHGGEILARNHPQGGAIFQVRLPAATISSFGSAGVVDKTGAIVHGRILLVDDEEAVLDFEREVLAGAGAQVVSTTEAQEALELIAREEYDAIIIDGRMPGGWSGEELLNAIRENRPQLATRILLTLSNVGEGHDHLERARVPFLVKPFGIAELLDAVRRLIQGSRTGEGAFTAGAGASVGASALPTS
jgi:two-component system NtrC family sensor kinase